MFSEYILEAIELALYNCFCVLFCRFCGVAADVSTARVQYGGWYYGDGGPLLPLCKYLLWFCVFHAGENSAVALESCGHTVLPLVLGACF